MSKSKTVTKITEVITQAAPELQFVAAYNAVYKWWNMKGENRRTCVYHPFYFVCLFIFCCRVP